MSSDSPRPRNNIRTIKKAYVETKTTIVLPMEIDHNTYYSFVKLCENIAAQDSNGTLVDVICTGYGGEFLPCIAISDYMRSNPNNLVFRTLLYGGASSGNSIIFCSGQVRYVSPLGYLGIHGIQEDSYYSTHTSGSSKTNSELLLFKDGLAMEVYTSSSNKPVEWWSALFTKAATSLCVIRANDMIEYGLARPVSKMTTDLIDLVHVEPDSELDSSVSKETYNESPSFTTTKTRSL